MLVEVNQTTTTYNAMIVDNKFKQKLQHSKIVDLKIPRGNNEAKQKKQINTQSI